MSPDDDELTAEDLAPRIEHLEEEIEKQGEEITRGRERSAADLARFEAVGTRIGAIGTDFHRALSASEGRQREDIAGLRDEVKKLGNGQAVILQEIRKGNGGTPPAHSHQPPSPGESPVTITKTEAGMLAAIPTYVKVIFWSVVGVAGAIAGIVMALANGVTL